MAHIAIDLQREYCNPHTRHGQLIGPSAYHAGAVIGPVKRFARDMQGHGLKNIWVAHNFTQRSGYHVPRELYRITPAPGDATIAKKYFDAFKDTGLDDTLRRANTRALLLTGAFFEQCVFETAMSAARRGYDTYVVCDLTATVTNKSIRRRTAIARELQENGVRFITAGKVRMLLSNTSARLTPSPS